MHCGLVGFKGIILIEISQASLKLISRFQSPNSFAYRLTQNVCHIIVWEATEIISVAVNGPCPAGFTFTALPCPLSFINTAFTAI